MLYVQFSLHKTLPSMPDHFENASSGPETSPVGVATKIARKYRRMHHTRSPLSTTARRLLLNKLHVGESRSVDLSSLCHHTSSAFLSSREPEL